MKIVKDGSEARLFEKVKSMKDQPHNSWRCLYFHCDGAYKADLRQRWQAGMLAALEGMEGYIFLCSDGDIFILFQGALAPVMGKLARHGGGLAYEPHVIFDLGVHWQAFYQLCRSKFIHAAIVYGDIPPLFSYRPPQAYAE